MHTILISFITEVLSTLVYVDRTSGDKSVITCSTSKSSNPSIRNGQRVAAASFNVLFVSIRVNNIFSIASLGD